MPQKQAVFSVQDAISNPSNFYRTPGEVLGDARLSKEDKYKILDSWEVDQTNLMVAESENMTTGTAQQGRAAEKLRTISKAKEALH